MCVRLLCAFNFQFAVPKLYLKANFAVAAAVNVAAAAAVAAALALLYKFKFKAQLKLTSVVVSLWQCN